MADPLQRRSRTALVQLACAFSDRAHREHIGSRLDAKPIIDIMVGTEAHHNIEAVRSTLVYVGYEDMGEAGIPGRIYLRKRSAPAFNIALVERCGPVWISNLVFRDYLRKNPAARNEYTRIKIQAVESGICSYRRSFAYYFGSISKNELMCWSHELLIQEHVLITHRLEGGGLSLRVARKCHGPGRALAPLHLPLTPAVGTS